MALAPRARARGATGSDTDQHFLNISYCDFVFRTLHSRRALERAARLAMTLTHGNLKHFSSRLRSSRWN
eukprot:12369230-Karenia_brevis.AAC.1